jgi:hypothetical protein
MIQQIYKYRVELLMKTSIVELKEEGSGRKRNEGSMNKIK